MSSSRKDIFDALTSDSSLDGCDPDWRREVLDNADPSDLFYIRGQLGFNTEGEVETMLQRRSGNL